MELRSSFRRPPATLIAFIFLISLLIAGCSGSGQAQQNQAAQGGGRGTGDRDAIAVRMAPVQRISIQRMVDVSGSLISQDQVRVSSEVAGIVSMVNAELGQEVQAGQVLIQLDTRELQLALDRADSALRQTEAQLGIDSTRPNAMPADEQIASVRTALANRDEARLKLNQTQELVSKGLLPKSDLDTMDTRLKVAEASVQSSLENVRALKASLQDRRASVELARKKVADAAIRAPVSGAISERLVQRGEFIRETTHVVTIVQLNPLKLQTAVQEKYANVIRVNLPVQFRVEPFPEELFQGRISNISPSINQDTRTFPVEVLVGNANRRLKPGFFAKGAILTNLDTNVMAVPQEAISTLAGVSSVYVVENGVVRQQNVTLGVQEGTLFEVISGLNGNEILAASNLPEITSGRRVIELGSTQPAVQNTETTRGTGQARPPAAPGDNQGRRRGRGDTEAGEGGNE
jgi:RND family efflux transporter MFP subunit